MAVGKSSEQPLNCCHHTSCVLCADSEALVIHARAMSWHCIGTLISVHGTHFLGAVCIMGGVPAWED